MDCRPKCEMQNCQTPKDIIEENLGELRFRDVFRYNTKNTTHGRKKLTGWISLI